MQDLGFRAGRRKTKRKTKKRKRAIWNKNEKNIVIQKKKGNENNKQIWTRKRNETKRKQKQKKRKETKLYGIRVRKDNCKNTVNKTRHKQNETTRNELMIIFTKRNETTQQQVRPNTERNENVILLAKPKWNEINENKNEII